MSREVKGANQEKELEALYEKYYITKDGRIKKLEETLKKSMNLLVQQRLRIPIIFYPLTGLIFYVQQNVQQYVTITESN